MTQQNQQTQQKTGSQNQDQKFQPDVRADKSQGDKDMSKKPGFEKEESDDSKWSQKSSSQQQR